MTNPIRQDTLNRRTSLDRLIARLDRRIRSLETLSDRFFWFRLGVFVLGGLGTWLAASQVGGQRGWLALLVSAAVFFLVVNYHRRLDRQLKRIRLWRGFRNEQAQRRILNWGEIQDYEIEHPEPLSSLAVDLDLLGPKSLHHLIDISVTQEGSRVLADWLTIRTPKIEEVARRQEIVRELVPAVRFRDRMRLEFLMLSDQRLRGQDLLSWLEPTGMEHRLGWLLPVSALLVAGNVLLFILSAVGILPPIWVLTLLLYGIFYFSNARQIGEFLDQIVRLDAALDGLRAVVRFLEGYSYPGQESLAVLCAAFRNPDNLPSTRMRRIKLVTAAVGLRMNPVLSFIVNLVLPWDFLFAFLAARLREAVAVDLPVWFQTWNQLEALISLANYAYLNPEYCFPQIDPAAEPVIQADRLGPPAGKKPNDFTVARIGEVAIITGSNMAGKSTFIKTLGVNMCLAYAGGPVSASQFCTVPFRLHSCIRISDSLSDGYSYFYAEVRCLKGLLETLRDEGELPVLYLIDEIYRGTNNRERLVGSRAFIKEIVGRSGVGLLATHDLELASLAAFSPLIRNFHFRDHVADGRLQFDFQLHPGPSPTTNALRIMEMEGLPVEPPDET